MSFFLFLFPGRPCVDCHAFEFMQRALQDLKKMAYNLDTRVCASAEKLFFSLCLQAARSACLHAADISADSLSFQQIGSYQVQIIFHPVGELQ